MLRSLRHYQETIVTKALWPALALTATLAACGTAGEYGAESPYYRAPAGSAWTLLRALDIPAGAASVRLQFGQPVARNAVQDVYPHCVLEIDTVSDGPQTVTPDRFDIVDSHQEVGELSASAGAGFIPVGFGLRDGGPSHLYYKTVFRLHSPRQPGVRWLTCQNNQAMQAFRQPLTLADMRGALGSWFRFDAADATR